MTGLGAKKIEELTIEKINSERGIPKEVKIDMVNIMRAMKIVD